MADAQLMEEELQQSVLMSEPDAELGEEHVANSDVIMGNGISLAQSNQIDVEPTADVADQDEEMADGEEGQEEHRDEDLASDQDLDDDEDQQLEEDHNDHSNSEEEDDDSDDGFEEEDAEGEEEDTAPHRDQLSERRIPSVEDDHDDEEEEDDEDDDERVGAVKIKPGETDDEDDDSDASSNASSVNISDLESEDSVAWEDNAARVEGDDDDEEESDNANANACIFCKQDEEHDPSEEFEVYLACSRCGDNGPESWRCPHCVGEGSEAASDQEGEDAEESNQVHGANGIQTSRRATAPKLARDLLPPQKPSTKPDSHSVFNHLVLDEDPLDGSRVLRKRKTSSVEADENVMALRKRRRNTADESDDDANGNDESTRPLSSRSLRVKTPNPSAAITRISRTSLLIQFKVKSPELRQILSKKPSRDKKRSGRSRARPSRAGASRTRGAPLPPNTTPFTTTSYSQPFYSFYDKETDELKGKPYGGILTEAEADTSKTLPTNDDRRRFDDAKQKAEEEWRQRLLKMQAGIEVPTRKSKKVSGPASQIECVDFGGFEIDTWYAAPYPEEYSRNRVLYICEFCLKYMNSDYVAWRHKLKCPAKHPPGDEIYRHDSVSVFEVDGRKNPVYCQNLCLLAKLFLGSKTLYYDVEPFLFYVLCEYDDLGYHFVGYFSKEKRASSQNNVSCILTLPIHQRKGYGNLLIDFSYLLTRVEQKTGSPEKPLSDMGLVSYRNYWRLVMCRYLLQHCSEDKTKRKGLSIKNISDDTGLTPDDVISALEGLRCLVRDPQTQVYAFRVDQQYCREYIAKWEAKKYVQLNPDALTWTPYVMGRSNATNFELGPAINAIAPREDAEEQKPVAAPAEGLVNGTSSLVIQTVTVKQEPKADNAAMVLESTEPNETRNNSMQIDDDTSPKSVDNKPNGILVNGDTVDHEEQDEVEPNNKDESEDWISQYKDIPPSRFEVVPPIAGARRADRSRAIIPRPPAVRTASGVSRPRPKRSDSSRRASSKQKSGSAKRKSGGTGRGPGRWPKGTKKSDYGNADSGPGLPPGWLERKSSEVAVPAKKDVKKEGADAKDTVQVQTPGIRETKSQRGGTESSSRRNGSIGEGSVVSKGRPSPRSQSSKENNNLEGDVVMRDVDDADAGDMEDDDKRREVRGDE
ncbi:hypothetical protein B0T17DRAFT_486733 [Bombardia bombarda]|uniref:Histone acetyltransferase n=1 Tax=Bombardia bombarda TaxID=252184 RepID=A0AA39X812_9PEZI|nr:hypothetical protein B0T17DRAFT_486733 [Bombardia bombarda]